MDIKGLINSVVPLSLRSKDKVDKAIKTDSATDRDANGQMSFGSGEQQREPMTDEQLAKALKHLAGLDVVKNNNLTIDLQVSNGKKFVIITDPSGRVVRRIPELELWDLQAKNGEKGQLLSKSA